MVTRKPGSKDSWRYPVSEV